ncbi:hypothetical protein [Xenorhabdus mauleonii]|uniref:hypothetical protein n=1 Tax=Xenorhabdus mauleonii TaxID=351675 RepID=UPI001113860E|nr:hypothetical protein [Xenorhabdus mauleonii]
MAKKAPVACKGAHYPAVHLRTFGSRYRQTITHRPTMKVIRCHSPGLSRNTNSAGFALSRIPTINVLNVVRRHLRKSSAITK